jgi:heptosyltransferase-1
MIALTRRAALLIGGDTGPVHLAAALGRPVVALFGPTDPERNGPNFVGARVTVLRDPASITSHKRSNETETGLQRIRVEEVLAAALAMLEGNK